MYSVTHRKYGELLLKPGKNACPRCNEEGGDSHGDNLFAYGEGKGAYCWACGFTIRSDDKENEDSDGENVEDAVTNESSKEPISKEQNDALKACTTTEGRGYRGIRDEINVFFGVRYQYSETNGELLRQYVPTTIESGLAGYRVRTMPKDFTKGHLGIVGKQCEMIGQFRFKNHSHTCIITGGEVKLLATYQMMKDHYGKKGDSWEIPAVVCSTLGEGAAFKQVAAQYQFFSKFKKIVVCMDADDPGREAAEKVAKALPKGRVFIMEMRYKDADEYIAKKDERAFIDDFWKAKPYTPDGVKTAAQAFEGVPEELSRPRITLPPYMHKMQEMMGGGIRQGRIVNIIADTSIGKTTQVRRMVYHWIFHSPVVPTIVSLEDTAGQYILDLICVHLEENLLWHKTEAEVIAWLDTPEGQQCKHELCFREDGSPRFYIIDERGGSIKVIEEKMEEMYKQYGSKLFVIDVLTDLLRGSNADYGEDHMNFQKTFIKEGATIINVHHTRKPPQSADGKLRKVGEYDVLGTGSFVQSGAINIVMNRDKLAEDPIVRNTTEVDLPKCRGGKTGPAGKWYYDFATVKCFDLDDWLTTSGPKDF